MERDTQPRAQFDAICEQLDEFEPLPSVAPAELELAHGDYDSEQRREPLDGRILAGLVSP